MIPLHSYPKKSCVFGETGTQCYLQFGLLSSAFAVGNFISNAKSPHHLFN